MMLYVAIGYMVVIRDMLREYLENVCRKLTLKEKKARADCIKELGLEKMIDFKKQPISIKLRVKRLIRFFFLRKVPPSVIRAGPLCC